MNEDTLEITDEDLRYAWEQVKRYGPRRVIVNREGEGMTPAVARSRGISNGESDIVFIRNDGWTLGAPSYFEGIAHRLWQDAWVAFVRKPFTDPPKPMSEYGKEDGRTRRSRRMEEEGITEQDIHETSNIIPGGGVD